MMGCASGLLPPTLPAHLEGQNRVDGMPIRRPAVLPWAHQVGGTVVDLESERLERTQLETLSTSELIRHALSETRLLVKAEVMHAKKELKQELQAAKTAGIFLGAG